MTCAAEAVKSDVVTHVDRFDCSTIEMTHSVELTAYCDLEQSVWANAALSGR